jgi:RNA polymerase sigma factor (sigma-70 family)
MKPYIESATTDEQLAALFLESPDAHREAFAERCTVLLRAQIRNLVCVKGMCPGSASRDTFADDVFSLALFRLAQALDQLKSPEGLRNWLMAIAKSAVMDEIFSGRRRMKSGPIRFDSFDDLVARAAEEPKAARILSKVENTTTQYHSRHWRDPEESASINERLQFLKNVYTQHSAASNRGAECGNIVSLYYEREMSFEQVAGVLHQPKSTVHEILQDNMTTYRKMCLRALGERTAHNMGSTL